MSRPQGKCGENHKFFQSSFQQEFLSMSSEFTFGDNSDEFGIFRFFFLDLVDRDLTEYQITRTLTLSRLHAQLEQTRGIRLFTHTQRVDWSRQGESNCLIIFSSKQENPPSQRSENQWLWRTCVYHSRCWQRLAELENSGIHSQCVSCRMNLDAGIRRMSTFPFLRLWKRSQGREIP